MKGRTLRITDVGCEGRRGVRGQRRVLGERNLSVKWGPAGEGWDLRVWLEIRRGQREGNKDGSFAAFEGLGAQGSETTS